MADLIDRAALEKALEQINICIAVDKTKMFRLIKNAPAVDAVEVVRCKDCKHVESVVTPYGERWSCYAWDRYTYPDGYCQEGEFDGERRDNNE